MNWTERLGGAEAVTAGIVEEFRGLSARPHGSGHEEGECAYLLERLKRLGLSPVRDGAGNVMADVPPTPGREHAPRLIVQGHMDMVCAVAPGGGFDPLRDGVTVVTEGGFLRSDGRSSLGADNNLGNAAVLFLLEKKVPHGPLRLLFTVSEEVGLKGAAQVDPAWLAGAECLLNTDGFHLGLAVTGSAGGRRETYVRPVDWEAARGNKAFEVLLSGGLGGHSGDDIHRRRLNALWAMSALLEDRLFPWAEVADFSGGTGHNVIPGGARIVVVLPAGKEAELRYECEMFQKELNAYWGQSEPDLRVTITPAPCPKLVWSEETSRAVYSMVSRLYHGVFAMHPAFPNVVGASANVGQLAVEQNQAVVRTFLRCVDKKDEETLIRRNHDVARNAGFTLAQVSSYPSWPGDGDNHLVRTLCRAYEEETGRTMAVTAVHVGLEPSVLGAKNPAMVMASTGPDILDAHAITERAPLAGLPDYAALLAGTLENL